MEEHKLRVLENRVLRRIFGPKRDEMTGCWRNCIMRSFVTCPFFLPSIIRMIKSRMMIWAEHVAQMRERRNAYSILVGKPEGKKPLGRSRRRWVDNNGSLERWDGMDWIGLDWIDFAEDREQWRALVNTVVNLWVP
jgi:hypothetical protein